MPGLVGKKVGMTSVFDANGVNVPCTVLEIGPCVVTQVKTKESDGYKAISLPLMKRRKKIRRQCHERPFQEANTTPNVRWLNLPVLFAIGKRRCYYSRLF